MTYYRRGHSRPGQTKIHPTTLARTTQEALFLSKSDKYCQNTGSSAEHFKSLCQERITLPMYHNNSEHLLNAAYSVLSDAGIWPY